MFKIREKFARNKNYLADNSFSANLENAIALKLVLAA